MDAYELHDARYIQYAIRASAVGELALSFGPVPNNVIWTILSAIGSCNVSETQDYWYSVLKAGVSYFSVTEPHEFIINPAINRGVPLLREGMELKLFPSEFLTLHRDAATAGSNLTLHVRFLENDLPFYSYEEPLKKVVRASQRHGSAFRSSGMISIGGPSGGRTGRGEGGADGGGAEPL
jgi:hypothetical protein